MGTLLAFDVAMSNFGWVAFEVSPLGDEIVECGVISTQPTPQKKRGLQSDDDVRRGRLLYRDLYGIFYRRDPVAVAAEMPSGAQNARAAKLLGMATQCIAGLMEQFPDVMFEFVTQRDVKIAVTGESLASKDHIIETVTAAYPGYEDWPRGDDGEFASCIEHICDAIGAMWAVRTLGQGYRLAKGS